MPTGIFFKLASAPEKPYRVPAHFTISRIRFGEEDGLHGHRVPAWELMNLKVRVVFWDVPVWGASSID